MYFVEAFLDELSKLAAEGAGPVGLGQRVGRSGQVVTNNPILKTMRAQQEQKERAAKLPAAPSSAPPPGFNPFLPGPKSRK